MSEFTPIAGLIGGALIGTSAVVLLGGIGRLAGISNIAHGLLEGLLQSRPNEWRWRLVFLIGLVGGAWAYFALTGATVNPRLQYPPALLIGGGLLVGYGTSLGNGCTSGHGVCGLGRLSIRSLVATLVFMATGGLTVWLIRHVIHIA